MRSLIAAAAAVAALTLAGCSTPQEPAAAPETTAAPSQASEPSQQPTSSSGSGIGEPGGVSERGHQITEIGRENQLWDADLAVGTWTITAITPYDMSAHPEYDQATTYYLLEMQAAATSDLTADLVLTWGGVDAEGYEVNGDVVRTANDAILPSSDTVPMRIGPGEKIRGKVLIGMPGPGGSLVIGFEGGSAQGLPVPYKTEIALP